MSQPPTGGAPRAETPSRPPLPTGTIPGVQEDPAMVKQAISR